MNNNINIGGYFYNTPKYNKIIENNKSLENLINYNILSKYLNERESNIYFDDTDYSKKNIGSTSDIKKQKKEYLLSELRNKFDEIKKLLSSIVPYSRLFSYVDTDEDILLINNNNTIIYKRDRGKDNKLIFKLNEDFTFDKISEDIEPNNDIVFDVHNLGNYVESVNYQHINLIENIILSQKRTIQKSLTFINNAIVSDFFDKFFTESGDARQNNNILCKLCFSHRINDCIEFLKEHNIIHKKSECILEDYEIKILKDIFKKSKKADIIKRLTKIGKALFLENHILLEKIIKNPIKFAECIKDENILEDEYLNYFCDALISINEYSNKYTDEDIEEIITRYNFFDLAFAVNEVINSKHDTKKGQDIQLYINNIKMLHNIKELKKGNHYYYYYLYDLAIMKFVKLIGDNDNQYVGELVHYGVATYFIEFIKNLPRILPMSYNKILKSFFGKSKLTHNNLDNIKEITLQERTYFRKGKIDKEDIDVNNIYKIKPNDKTNYTTYVGFIDTTNIEKFNNKRKKQLKELEDYKNKKLSLKNPPKITIGPFIDIDISNINLFIKRLTKDENDKYKLFLDKIVHSYYIDLFNLQKSDERYKNFHIINQTTVNINNKYIPDCGETVVINFINLLLWNKYTQKLDLNLFPENSKDTKIYEMYENILSEQNPFKIMNTEKHHYKFMICTYGIKNINYISDNIEIIPTEHNFIILLKKLLNIEFDEELESTIDKLNYIIKKFGKNIKLEKKTNNIFVLDDNFNIYFSESHGSFSNYQKDIFYERKDKKLIDIINKYKNNIFLTSKNINELQGIPSMIMCLYYGIDRLEDKFLKYVFGYNIITDTNYNIIKKYPSSFISYLQNYDNIRSIILKSSLLYYINKIEILLYEQNYNSNDDEERDKLWNKIKEILSSDKDIEFINYFLENILKIFNENKINSNVILKLINILSNIELDIYSHIDKIKIYFNNLEQLFTEIKYYILKYYTFNIKNKKEFEEKIINNVKELISPNYIIIYIRLLNNQLYNISNDFNYENNINLNNMPFYPDPKFKSTDEHYIYDIIKNNIETDEFKNNIKKINNIINLNCNPIKIIVNIYDSNSMTLKYNKDNFYYNMEINKPNEYIIYTLKKYLHCLDENSEFSK